MMASIILAVALALCFWTSIGIEDSLAALLRKERGDNNNDNNSFLSELLDRMERSNERRDERRGERRGAEVLAVLASQFADMLAVLASQSEINRQHTERTAVWNAVSIVFGSLLLIFGLGYLGQKPLADAVNHQVNETIAKVVLFFTRNKT
jgi:hypothetical protein